MSVQATPPNQNDILADSSVLYTAATCCFLSAITTIGIHAGWFDFASLTGEDRYTLFQNPGYIAGKWWIIAHCLFVMIAMWGVFLLRFRSSPGWTGLGFIFYVVFGVTEIARQFLVLFYLNGLRKSLLMETDPHKLTVLTQALDQFGFISSALFGLFILAFTLGNLFYGFSLIQGDRTDRWMGIILLIWALTTAADLANTFINNAIIEQIIAWFGIVVQPLIRILLTVWLLRFTRLLPSTYRVRTTEG